MRTIDPIFSAAAADGTGIPFARLVYGSNSYPIHKFHMEGFTLKAYANDFPIAASAIPYQLKRGLTIQGVDYEITSPYFYPTKVIAPMAGASEIEISLNIFKSSYLNFTSIDASLSAAQVIESALLTFAHSHLATYVAGETWINYQFDRSGANLNLNNFNGLIPMLFNKYGVRIFPRDVNVDSDGVFLCLSRLAVNHLTGDEYSWLTNTSDKLTMVRNIDRTTQFNVFWTDEADVSHKLSATYPAVLTSPVRNVGFFHTAVTAAEIKAMHYDLSDDSVFLHHDIYTLRFTPEVENGDYLKIANSYFLFAEIEESFNMPGTLYPWQTKINGARMFYSVGVE